MRKFSTIDLTSIPEAESDASYPQNTETFASKFLAYPIKVHILSQKKLTAIECSTSGISTYIW